MASTAKVAKKSNRGSGTTKPKNLPATAGASSEVAIADKPFRRTFDLKEGVLTITDTPESEIQHEQAFGSNDRDFQTYALLQILSLLRGADRETDSLNQIGNAAIAFLAALKPADEVEAMLGVQMFMAHHHSMVAGRRLAGSDLLEQANANGNLATKFSRTFAMQLDTLSRLRRGGEQVVKHVHVNEGGQAVIAGTVNSGGSNV